MPDESQVDLRQPVCADNCSVVPAASARLNRDVAGVPPLFHQTVGDKGDNDRQLRQVDMWLTGSDQAIQIP